MYKSYLNIVFAESKMYQKDLKFEYLASVVVSLKLSLLLHSGPVVSSLVVLSLCLPSYLFLTSSRCFSRPVAVSLFLYRSLLIPEDFADFKYFKGTRVWKTFAS